MQTFRGFTLAELLLTLAILGIIATFTIPKVLNSQQNGKFKAIGKEAAGMVTGAMIAYKQQNTLQVGTKPSDLTPYMNYVAVDTTSVVDDAGARTCGSDVYFNVCLRLHNGALLVLDDDEPLSSPTASTDGIWFGVDPDGKYTGDPENILWLKVFTTNRITTFGVTNGTPASDPSWFSWN